MRRRRRKKEEKKNKSNNKFPKEIRILMRQKKKITFREDTKVKPLAENSKLDKRA